MIKKLKLAILLCLFSCNAFSQIDSSLVNESPHNVVYNHLHYLQTDSYDPIKSALSIPDSNVDNEELAIRLKQILDGRGMFIDINRLPQNKDYGDSLDQAIYTLDKKEPLIYLEKLNGNWFYSRTTIQAVPSLHKDLYPFGTKFVMMFDNPFWQVSLLGIALWKWLGIIILFLLSLLIYLIVRKGSHFFIKRVINRKIEITEKVNDSLLKMSQVVGLILAVRFVLFILPMFQVNPRMNSLMIKGFNILSIFFFVILIKEIVKVAFRYFEKLTRLTENTLDDQLLPVLYKLTMIVVWAIGGIYILDYMDVNVTALLAGISIGALALALAAQDTVKNFFGTIMIFLDKPFQIGDYISFNGVNGTIEEVGVRSTRIRTFANSVTTVPNALLADSIIDNLGLRLYRRFNTEIGITYGSTTEQIEKFVDGIREIIRLHPGTRKDAFEVHLNSFGSSSINILLYMFFEAESWTEELNSKHDILLAIIKLAEKLGVEFAFPTQTIHIAEIPENKTSKKPITNSESKINKDLQEILKEIGNTFNKK